MPTIILLLTIAAAVIHVLIMVAEMFFWQKFSRRVVGYDKEMAARTQVLGTNQGLYNGFLAAGLWISLLAPLPEGAASTLQVFSLACVAVAGIVGAYTLERINVLWVQAGPAVIALALMVIA